MNPQPNFFFVNRSLLDHPCLSKNRSWQLAWVYIIGRTKYETGKVVLTEVYRELEDMFSYEQWRYFVRRCVKEGMLSDLETENQGKTAGFRQTAKVSNYDRYQAENLNRAVNSAKHEHTTEPTTEHLPVTNEKTSPPSTSTEQCKEREKPELRTESIKKDQEYKDSKEKKEDDDERPLEQNHGSLYDRVYDHEPAFTTAVDIIQTDAGVWESVTDFVNLCGGEKVKDQTLHVWIAELGKDIIRYGPEKVKTSVKTTVENPKVTNPWAYYRKCVESPQPDRAACEKSSAGSGAARAGRRGADKFEGVIAEKRRKDAEWFAKHGYGGQDGKGQN